MSRYIESIAISIAQYERNGPDYSKIAVLTIKRDICIAYFDFRKGKRVINMRILHDLLCDLSKRIPLATLIKCEEILERTDFNSSHYVPISNPKPETSKE